MDQESTAIIALGGNTLVKPGEKGNDKNQLNRVKKTLKKLKPIIEKGKTAITHGNGPQVGNILIQQEKSKEEIPTLPLDTCGAMSQGQIGYYLEKASNPKTVSLITQVEVDEDDPAFENPTKPIGPYYYEKPNRGWKMKKEREGWRRVVPSPEPRRIVEIDQIKQLLKEGFNVVTCGGGGIPVKNTKNGLKGVEAVIDKDKATALLGKQINAEKMYLITDVPYVYRNYGTENQEKIEKMTQDQAQKLLEKDEFEEGSMKPKIEAAVRFLSSGGKKAVVTDIENADKIPKGKGTTIE